MHCTWGWLPVRLPTKCLLVVTNRCIWDMHARQAKSHTIERGNSGVAFGLTVYALLHVLKASFLQPSPSPRPCVISLSYHGYSEALAFERDHCELVWMTFEKIPQSAQIPPILLIPSGNPNEALVVRCMELLHDLMNCTCRYVIQALRTCPAFRRLFCTLLDASRKAGWYLVAINKWSSN